MSRTHPPAHHTYPWKRTKPPTPLRRARVPDEQGTPELALRLTGQARTELASVPLRSGGLTLLEMARGFQPVRHHLLLTCAQRGCSVFQVVASNRLDSTALARTAQAWGLDPRYVLSSSLIARAFTAYQLSVLIEETLPEHLDSKQASPLAIVDDPLALFTDEDVPRNEGVALAEHAFQALAETAATQDVAILVVQPPRGGPAYARRLLDLAVEHVRVREHPGGQGRIIEKPREGLLDVIQEPGWQQATLDRFTSPTHRGGRGALRAVNAEDHGGYGHVQGPAVPATRPPRFVFPSEPEEEVLADG